MAYIKGKDRKQYLLFPPCLDEYIGEDDPVRLFDAFVDNMDMKEMGFKRYIPADTGTPGYNPRDLMKLYIYGYYYEVRSSRKLERQCHCNLEVKWLINNLEPDFRTISDFRKDNKKAIVSTFKAFNRFCRQQGLFSKTFISVDGSKFKAVNAKDRNFTLNKLDDRIARLDHQIDDYMRLLDETDRDESRKLSRDELEDKLVKCTQRKMRYESYRDSLQKSGEKQISLTDPDARLMKANEGFCVGYNTQVAVDAESHLIAGFDVTNDPTDHGKLTKIAGEVKKDYEVDILEATADKGYESPQDYTDALAAGIVPNVIQRNGMDTVEVSFNYSQADITEEQRADRATESLKRCLEAGVIPDMYEGVLTDPQIHEVRFYSSRKVNAEVQDMSDEEMRAKAAEGYFVRDADRNLVYCPQGRTLRQKAVKRNGMIRYCNKMACKQCQDKCTSSGHKEVDFDKDKLIIKAKATGKSDRSTKGNNLKPRSHRKTFSKKMVRYILHLDRNKMEQRKCLSEHPFGTLKRTLGQYYFMLKGFKKVSAEMALFCLSYNIRRAINMKSVPVLIKSLK